MRLGTLLLLSLLGIAIAGCGGGDGGNGGPSTPNGARELSEEEFPAVRDELAGRIDAIGVNIGAVPEDVRRALLRECASLASQADDGDVEAICDAFGQAMESDDSGLAERVIGQLRALESD